MTQSIHDESLRYWSQRAQEYSALHMDEYASPKQKGFAAVLDRYAPQLSRPIDALDVGCGSGFLSLILADRGCKVTGVDFSEDMVAQAGGNARTMGFDIEFRQMEAQNLQFADESFDFVVTRNVTWVLEDVGCVYAQMVRVLRSGGVLVNIDANYGRAFNEADERGEEPTHPTQSLQQLRTRNAIVRDLDITAHDRPQWDLVQLWNLGVRSVECHRNLDELMGHDYSTYAPLERGKTSKAPLFLIAAAK